MKSIKLTDILFYMAFAVVIIITVFFDRNYLTYALPIIIFSIGAIYFERAAKVNMWYVLSLVSMIVCDILIYTDFIKNFSLICMLTSLYFIFCTLALRKYLVIGKIKKNTFLSAPILVCTALIAYLIYSISQLLIDVVKEAIPEVVICLFSSTTYILVAYLIYMQDMYKEGLKLIIVAFLCIFIVSLLPINELFYPSDIFTVFVNIAHVLSLYIFMLFLVEDTPEKVTVAKEKFL
ncbi:hypothetical protein [Aquimarina rubra]|uniref:Lysoplasmalogenase n=1 Tax=Aquimarina rubra TaxID=1920033 RepID=A0ABW5LFI8_9FLAO